MQIPEQFKEDLQDLIETHSLDTESGIASQHITGIVTFILKGISMVRKQEEQDVE